MEGETMNRCKTCAHYNRIAALDGGKFGSCQSVTDDVTKDPKRAYVWDYEDYRAGFTVGEEFGCTLWEASA